MRLKVIQQNVCCSLIQKDDGTIEWMHRKEFIDYLKTLTKEQLVEIIVNNIF